MHKKEEHIEPVNSAPTDAEIAAAAERLSLTWGHPAPRSHAAGTSQIHQSLARGRSHMVALEIKRSSRRLGGPR